MKMKKYFSALHMGLQSSLEYRFDFFIGIVSSLFPIVIQVFLWYALYGGSNGINGGKSMYGYDFAQMMAYVAIAGTVSRFVGTGIEGIVNSDIHSGGLAVFLVKPVKYVQFRIFQTVGSKFTASVIFAVFTVFVLSVLHFSVGFEIVLSDVLFFLITLTLAAVLNFYLFFQISLTAFWLTEVGALFGVVSVIVMVLSGGVFPISVFGDWYVNLSQYLPFMYTTYFPISVLTGIFDTNKIITGIIMQVIWIAVLWFVSKIVWKTGLKKYVSVGG
jgi:ABC-2 type transport system permease protein